MFKKLKSLLFTEEEIVIEEEISKHDDALKIPELKPMVAKPVAKKTTVAKPIVEPTAPVYQEPTISSYIDTTQTRQGQPSQERKVVNIQADDALTMRQQKIRVDIKQSRRDDYQPKDIISPIFGGNQTVSDSGGKTSSSKQTFVDAKQRTPVTNVISPMFGKVIPEYDVDTEEGQKMMDLDITEMLAPERREEEVQVSLYDYLEELEHDKEK